jgi:hypothetical protein
MTGDVQFTVGADDGFFVTVAEEVTVYEAYADAVDDIRGKLKGDTDGFVAEVAIEDNGGSDDVTVTLEQVSWQQIIRDMTDPSAKDVNQDGEPEVGSDDDD